MRRANVVCSDSSDDLESVTTTTRRASSGMAASASEMAASSAAYEHAMGEAWNAVSLTTAPGAYGSWPRQITIAAMVRSDLPSTRAPSVYA